MLDRRLSASSGTTEIKLPVYDGSGSRQKTRYFLLSSLGQISSSSSTRQVSSKVSLPVTWWSLHRMID